MKTYLVIIGMLQLEIKMQNNTPGIAIMLLQNQGKIEIIIIYYDKYQLFIGLNTSDVLVSLIGIDA